MTAEFHDLNRERALRDEIKRIAQMKLASERDVAIDELVAKFGCKKSAIEKDVDALIKLLDKEERKGKRGDDPDLVAQFDKLNETFAVISMNGAVRVLREKAGGADFELMKERDFNLWLADREKIFVGERKQVALSTLWLEYAGHRKFEGVCFEPGVLLPEGSKYNLWRGWGVEPSELGSCELYKRHLRDNVFPSDELFDYAWKLNAHRFQFPRIKPTVSIATIGEEGVWQKLRGGEDGQAARRGLCSRHT